MASEKIKDDHSDGNLPAGKVDSFVETAKYLESQSRSSEIENTVSIHSKLLFLGAWFSLNLVLTISNKAVLAQARFPWLLTTVHTATTTLGCFALVGFGSLKPTRLTREENVIMLAFSALFTVNIATSNVSLALVSVPLHQVLRSTCPIAAIMIYRFQGRTYPTATYLSIIPLILGVALATIGDYYCTMYGLFLTLLGVPLAAMKTVATNKIMTGSLALTALEVLLRMSPLATIQCVICAFMTGEVQAAHIAYAREELSSRFALALLANGLIAFLLNIVSMQANKLAGALTMTVAGNMKQALTILIGIMWFNLQTGFLNATGIAVTLAGAALYSKVELDTKRAKLAS